MTYTEISDSVFDKTPSVYQFLFVSSTDTYYFAYLNHHEWPEFKTVI